MTRPASISILGSAVVFASLAAREARLDGPTLDEPAYVISASRMGERGDPGNSEQPPLAKLLFLQGQRLFATPRPAQEEALLLWASGDGLMASRAVSIGAGAILCALVAWAALPYGAAAAGGAGLLAALTPSLLAHGHLATLDMLLTLFFVASCLCTEAFVRRRNLGMALLIAAAVGAAVTTKWTALPLLGALPLAAFVSSGGAPRERLGCASTVLCACLAGLALSLGVSVATVGLDSLAGGLAFQLQHARQGHDVVVLGRRRSHGTPYFYLLTLALVSPFALWPLAIRGLRSIKSRACVWLPALVLFVVLSFSRVQLGVRYILPAYFPLLVAAAAGFAALRSRGRGPIALGLLAAFAASSLASPSHIPYRNELRYLSRWRGLEWLPESDGDWGQDAPLLAADVKRLGLEKVCIAWYGTPVWRAHAELVARASSPGQCTTGAVGAFLLFSQRRFEQLKTRAPLNPGGTIFLFDLAGAPQLAAAWREPRP